MFRRSNSICLFFLRRETIHKGNAYLKEEEEEIMNMENATKSEEVKFIRTIGQIYKLIHNRSSKC